MDFSTVRTALEQTCDFPVEQAAVLAEVGDQEIESPTGESIRIETVLRRTDETAFQSPRGVVTSLAGMLDGSFVGRRGYDDRSHNPVRSAQVSF